MNGGSIRIDPIEHIARDIPIGQFSGDVNGYGIRIDPTETITNDIPIQRTITTAIPTPLPRRSILREPRRSVHFVDGNIFQTNVAITLEVFLVFKLRNLIFHYTKYTGFIHFMCI